MGAGLAIQPHAATERCPWCGSAVTRVRFLEIEEKIAERERKKLSEERTRMAQELRDEARKNALRLKAETDKRIIVVSRARIAEIVGLLRDAMVRMHLSGLSQTERDDRKH